MEPFGVTLGSVPEPGYSAVLRYAQIHRKPVITVDFPRLFHEIPDEMVFKPLGDPPFLFDWFVACPKEAKKAATQQLRSLAGALAQAGG